MSPRHRPWHNSFPTPTPHEQQPTCPHSEHHPFAAPRLCLAQAYKTFYETELPDSAYQATWQRLQEGREIFAWGAWADGRLVGITHYLFHANIWTADICYLQDLFVDESVRGQGVAQVCKERNSPRLYWSTHYTNARARRLYDRVAKHHGFILYNYALG